MFEHQTRWNSLSLKIVGFMRPVTFQCTEWSSGKREVMIDTPAVSLQRRNGTKEQKTNMKLMSKALGFCLWSCIGVISEEGPCPCISLLSTPPSPLGSGMRRARAAHLGEWKEWSRGVCPEGE